VDAVVAAHSHQCLWHEINGVPVVQACSKGMALGRIELTVSAQGVRARALPPQLVCHDQFSDTGDCEAKLRVGAPRGRVVKNPLLRRHSRAVAVVRQMLSGYRRRLRPRPDQVIARAARPLPHRRQGVSVMGILLARVMRAAVPGAQVALVNAGGVRAGLAAGPITYNDVYQVFPFDNKLAYVDLTGRELKALVSGYLGRESSGFLLAAGLRYRVRCGQPLQVTQITDEKGRPLSDAQTYRVAISDFLMAGGVGFGAVLGAVPAARKKILAGRLIRDALVRHLKGLSHPVNDAAHPVLRPGAPPIVVENGPCERRPRKRRPRHICR
jgi:5'-nucleotidase